MSNNERNPEELGADIFRRLDPGGELGEMLRAFAPLIGSRLGRGFLRSLHVDVYDMERLTEEPHVLARNMTDSVLIFTPVGWAPSSRVPINSYTNALAQYRRTHDLAEAEAILVESWNESNRLRILLKPLISLGAGYEPLQEKFRLRWRLIDKALRHHEAGAYEASVPIVLAQVDGVVWDLTEQRSGFFYGKGQESFLVDDGTVAGLPEGLEPLRKLMNRGLRESGATGALVRHGILHGQELGYDTRENSTKVFVLLLAVIDWAQPRARALADRLHRIEEAVYAGSYATDDRGRRLDRRGFARAQEGLRNLAFRQLREHRHHGRYSDNLDEMFPAPGLEDDYVRNKNEITLAVSADRQAFWAWRSTPSGFYLGVSVTTPHYLQWFYAGVRPPLDGPWRDEGWKSVSDLPPDWT